MRLLIIGGTRFMGRHLTEFALAAGHEVTLFHRGETGADLFPEAEHVLGDRDGGFAPLGGGRWDAAVDMCGYFPRQVREATAFLADRVEHYTFISSISVYPDGAKDLDEDSPVIRLEDPGVEEITEKTYGGLKALCEEAAERGMPGRVLNVRSGLIVGPHDPTDRFTYWVRRAAAGGKVLAPLPQERPVQFIHAADGAAWILRMAERRGTGVFNVAGPQRPHTLAEVLTACREVSGSQAEFVWIPEAFLVEAGAKFWEEITLCEPGDSAGIMSVDISRALAEGLELRPLVQTARETLAWDAYRPPGTELKAGLAAVREAELLRRWSEGSA